VGVAGRSLHADTSGPPDLAERRLHGLLREAGLPSARLAIVRDDVEICELLEPSFWSKHTISQCSIATIRVSCRDANDPDCTRFEAMYFFVRRKELDQLYPTPVLDSPQAASDSSSDEPLPRTRKPKSTKHDWKRECGREIARKALAGEAEPPAKVMREWVNEKLDYWPDLSDMYKLLEILRFLF
jgi:hypothetical protein